MAQNLKASARRRVVRKARFWGFVRRSILVVCFAVPVVVFGFAGARWPYERGWLGWVGLGVLCAQALAYILFRRWGRTDSGVLPQPSKALPAAFAPRDEEAWKVVQDYVDRVDRGELTISSLEQLPLLGREILEHVATFYHPREQAPLLAVPLPLLFRAIEETARDMATVTAQLPLAHKVTVGDAVRGYRLQQKLQPAYQAYKMLSPLWNWKNALFQVFVADRLYDATKETLIQWLLKWYVDRVGYHAVELYSGKLLISHRVETPPELTAQGNGIASATQSGRAALSGPLRILVCGQVKAGKSSLINALFGEIRAATGVVPTTTHLTSYVLHQPQVGEAIVLTDMGGYEDSTAARNRAAEALTEATRADVIFLVISAVNVAREPDRRLLEQLRAHFAAHLEIRPSPLVIVLTHIDLLRPPREWSPPYNLAAPNSRKAHSIRGALDTVATECGVTPEVVIPVCLHPERRYNVEEGLVPLLVEVLPEAKRVFLLRGLKTLRQQEEWELLGRQAHATGRLLVHLGGEVLKKTLQQVLTGRQV